MCKYSNIIKAIYNAIYGYMGAIYMIKAFFLIA